MNAQRLENGNLLVPVRAESPGIIGDGMQEVSPDDPLFKDWVAYLARMEPEGQFSLPDRDPDTGRFVARRRKAGRGRRERNRRLGKTLARCCARKPEEKDS